MIYFVGSSFAPKHLKMAAIERGLVMSKSIKEANLIFISEDTPTDNGKRDLGVIRDLITDTIMKMDRGVLVLTSQVPPGFTRSLGFKMPFYHMAETLRVKDAAERAYSPEQFIVGCENPEKELPDVLNTYLRSFHCSVHQVTYEEAEFSKIAINMTLASQVENANRLSKAAKAVGANWEKIIPILQDDRRIGPHSYLTPGRWQDSQHLLRDYVTLKEIENETK